MYDIYDTLARQYFAKLSLMCMEGAMRQQILYSVANLTRMFRCYPYPVSLEILSSKLMRL